jgi:hypothetical protein
MSDFDPKPTFANVVEWSIDNREGVLGPYR